MRKHFVTFYSPGTMFAESDVVAIGTWLPVEAARMAKDITQRHGAKPYGFRFSTCIVARPVPDGEGGLLEVEPKEVARSGMFFLTGTVRIVKDIEAKADPAERILLSNMKGNGWAACVQNDNSYRSTQPFTKEDVVVDWDGNIVASGADYY